MKVLILTDRMGTGGAETHIALLARGLARMGVEVTVLSGGGRIADELEREGIRQIRFPVSACNPWLCLKLRRILKRLAQREGYDLFHAHARLPACLMRGLNRYGVAEIATVHAHFSVSPLLRRVCHWGSYTIAVSEDLRTYVLREYGVPPEQVRVIPNGIDCERFSPHPTPQKATGGCHILFASRLDADCSRGALLLCHAVPFLLSQDSELRVGIAGGGSMLSHVRSLADTINAQVGRPVITIHGTVCNMVPLLREADIFVGVSRAALEATACGCAVILCGNEGYMGILNASNASLAALSNFCCRGCPPATCDDLVRDLTTLLQDPMGRSALATNIREWVLRRYQAEQTCRATLSLYHRALRPRANAHVTVGGYFGCGNMGDDLILQGLLEGLHAIDPSIRVTALCRRAHKRMGIRCLARKNPFSVTRTLLGSRMFLCGGGSLLQNATGNLSLLYYLLLILLARITGARPILYAAGIGPLHGKHIHILTAWVLNQCAYISLRDPDSMLFLERIGVRRELLHQGADPALLVPLPPASRRDALLAAHGYIQKEDYFCIVLKGGRAFSDVRKLVLAASRMLMKRYDLTPVFISLDRAHDTACTQRAAREFGGILIPLQEPSDATALLSGARLTVTMRLHALIMATMSGIPAIGIPSDALDGKIPSFAELVGQEFIAHEELSVVTLVERMEHLLEANNRLSPLLLDAVADLRKKAKKDLENIVAMLYNNNQ